MNDEKKHNLFKWLQCVDEEELAFVIIEPVLFKPDYSPEVHKSALMPIQAEDEGSLILYSIVKAAEDVSKMTANLRAPIIVNQKNNKAMQIVLADDRYELKHYIFDEIKNFYLKKEVV